METPISETVVFVKIDNTRYSGLESDVFHINTNNILKLNGFLDIDGFYKMDLTFTDGKPLQFKYNTGEQMEATMNMLAGSMGRTYGFNTGGSEE